MKKMGMAVAGMFCAFAAFGEVAADETAKKPDSLKVLMIGNSFSEQMVPSMPPIARNLGLKLDVCSMFIGGCTLERHWKNICAPTSTPYQVSRASTDGKLHKAFKGNIPAVLASEKWDIVTIQQGSHLSWKSESYHPWGDNLVKYIRENAPQAKIVVHETWSYTPWDGRFAAWKIDQNKMYEKLHAAYADFAKGYGFDVIPTGTAVQLVRKELPVKYAKNSLGGDVVGNVKFVEKDGKWIPKGDFCHMGRDGNYLQALVWTAKLFGADVTKCSYAPKGMAAERAEFLRKMAMKALGEVANEVRALKVAPFATRTAKLELGGEFPGAKGRLSYTGEVVRVEFDFSNGGKYVWTSIGSLRERARRIGGWFRSEDGARLRLRVVDAKGDFYLMPEHSLAKGDWIRLDFDLSKLAWSWGPSKTAEARKSVKWPVRADFTVAGVKEKQRGALEMKDISCETTDTTLRDWAFRLAPLPYGALYYPGDEIRTEYGLCNLNADGAKPEVRLCGVRIADWQDKVVADLPITEQQGEIVLTAANLNDMFGAFTATIVGRDAVGQELELGRLRFARLSSREVKPCPWAGTCTHWTHGWGGGDFRTVDLIAAAGIGIVRTGPVWSGCEKQKGVYVLGQEYDTYVNKLGARGVKVDMVLAYGNGIYENPLDPDAFAGYCSWMADHFRGRVDCFEIWNEPNNFEVRKRYYRDGQPELVWVKKFIELTQRADDAIRAVRPDAVVAVASEDWDKFLDMMLTNGIARAHNAVAFHPYCHSQHRPEREFFLRDFGAKHRAYAKAHGGADRWCITEAGWTTFSGKGKFWEVAGFYPKASLPGQAACIVRMYLSALESGCDYACQYDFRDDGPNPRNAEQNFGLVYHDCAPKPSFAAVAFLTRLLGPAEFGKDCSPEPKKYRVASFRRGGVPIYALWAVEGEREIEIPSDVRGGFVFDLMGNRRDLGNQTKLMLTETPIYAVGRR